MSLTDSPDVLAALDLYELRRDIGHSNAVITLAVRNNFRLIDEALRAAGLVEGADELKALLRTREDQCNALVAALKEFNRLYPPQDEPSPLPFAR